MQHFYLNLFILSLSWFLYIIIIGFNEDMIPEIKDLILPEWVSNSSEYNKRVHLEKKKQR